MAERATSNGGGHADVRTYGIILAILAVVTAAEVGTYFMPPLQGHRTMLFVVLSVMAIAKFWLVVGYYMHLRYDATYYRRVFILPLLIAVAMIVVVALLTATRFLL